MTSLRLFFKYKKVANATGADRAAKGSKRPGNRSCCIGGRGDGRDLIWSVLGKIDIAEDPLSAICPDHSMSLIGAGRSAIEGKALVVQQTTEESRRRWPTLQPLRIVNNSAWSFIRNVRELHCTTTGCSAAGSVVHTTEPL